MENIKIFNDNDIQYAEYKISDSILNQLKNEVEFILESENKLKKYNKHLVGNIEKEYYFDKGKEILKSVLSNISKKFYKNLKNSETSVDFYIKDIWINLQKKYEYNPLHNHCGDLSFVLWIKIPYDLNKELELENSRNSNSPTNSLFHFVYVDWLKNIITYPIFVDKSYEGTIIMFPSSLNHIVYPFYTSNDYRISIAGNLNKNLKYQ